MECEEQRVCWNRPLISKVLVKWSRSQMCQCIKFSYVTVNLNSLFFDTSIGNIIILVLIKKKENPEVPYNWYWTYYFKMRLQCVNKLTYFVGWSKVYLLKLGFRLIFRISNEIINKNERLDCRQHPFNCYWGGSWNKKPVAQSTKVCFEKQLTKFSVLPQSLKNLKLIFNHGNPVFLIMVFSYKFK